jgi:hypothetical protein
MSRSIITLTTDFGLSDSYVAQMKARLLTIASECLPVDISHEIEPGNIRRAAYLLADGAPLFPDSTTHLIVVDPGVGTSRRRVVLRLRFPSGFHCFVGPDNGVFSALLELCEEKSVWEIDTAKLGVSSSELSTFDGRDVFAPAAANLANGMDVSAFAKEISPETLSKIELPKAQVRFGEEEKVVEGELVYFDHFGNAISNIEYEELEFPTSAYVLVEERETPLLRYLTYSDIPSGQIGLIRNSKNFWELSANGSSAKSLGRLLIGSRIRLHFSI